MNILSWNCRGTAQKGFVNLIKDLRREYHTSFICLMETHTCAKTADRILRRVQLDGQFVVEIRGQAGGIWCLWDPMVWKVNIIGHSDQFVHMMIKWKQTEEWALTVVYGSPHIQPRLSLCNALKAIASETSCPWAVIGDFNTILHEHDRKGGSQRPSLRGAA